MASRTSTNRKSARGEYIETDTGNKISRRSKIEGTPHIILGGRVVVQADACLRGDLVRLPSDASELKENTRTSISVGRYTVISSGATLHPPHRVFRSSGSTSTAGAPAGSSTTAAGTGVTPGELSYYPMKLGENVFIGPGAFISAASIGSNVYVGAGAVVGNGCVIRDGVKILDGAVLVPGMVAPSGVIVGGRPARILGELPDGWGMGDAGGGTAEGEEGKWTEGGELRELIRGIR